MSFDGNILAEFAPDGRQLAFQTGINQKNSVDIYPLDESTDFTVTSSLVDTIEYESHDLSLSSVLFHGWCTTDVNVDTGSRPGSAKRKLDGDAATRNARSENLFVNAFEGGQLVVFSASGKNIINIIKNKHEFLHVDTAGRYIWVLDSEKVVKKFDCLGSKTSKTFTLIDGKDQDIKSFKIVYANEEHEAITKLVIVTEEDLFLIDGSKRRPSTIMNMKISDYHDCVLTADGKKLVIAHGKTVQLFDLDSKASIHEWEYDSRHVSIWNNFVTILTINGELIICDISNTYEKVTTVKIPNYQIMGSVPVGDNKLLVSWLNVNEPNFKVLDAELLFKNNDVILQEIALSNADTFTAKDSPIQSPACDVKEQAREMKNSQKKERRPTVNEELYASKTLLELLDRPVPQQNHKIVEIALSDAWSESKIQAFVSAPFVNKQHGTRLISILSSQLEDNIWDSNPRLSMWIRWFFVVQKVNLKDSKEAKKSIKHIKSALKPSVSALPVLLGMQGRLEMLQKHIELRDDLSQLSVKESENILEKENQYKDQLEDNSKGNTDSTLYINGENDEFVDAPEYVK